MPDNVDAKTRSRMMAGIRGKDTRPEMTMRRALHALGFRYRLHDRKLPGKPDLVLPRYKAVIFIHGCFWHRHDCHLFKWPGSRKRFWRSKLDGNHKRDLATLKKLEEAGWRVLVIWECSLKGRLRRDQPKLVAEVAKWIQGRSRLKDLRGTGCS